jgi:hypothetical protein
MISEKSGRKETNTSLIISDLGGISSLGGLGAIEGLKYALVIAYPIYSPARTKPGNIAAANNLKGDNCAITE